MILSYLRKRILSILLCVAVLVGLFPVTALATEDSIPISVIAQEQPVAVSKIGTANFVEAETPFTLYLATVPYGTSKIEVTYDGFFISETCFGGPEVVDSSTVLLTSAVDDNALIETIDGMSGDGLISVTELDQIAHENVLSDFIYFSNEEYEGAPLDILLVQVKTVPDASSSLTDEQKKPLSDLLAKVTGENEKNWHQENDRFNGNLSDTITSTSGSFWKNFTADNGPRAQAQLILAGATNVAAIQVAVKDLAEEIARLIPITEINATSLYEEIQKQEGYNRTESNWTPSSWKIYKEALKTAKETLASLYDEDGKPSEINSSSNDATKKDVEDAETDLKNAAAGLVSWVTYDAKLTEAQWDWDSMQTLLSLQPKESDFTADTWNTYSAAKTAAQAWYDEHNCPEKADDGANYDDITGTIEAYQALYKGYYGLIDDQETITVTIYTFDGTTIATTSGDPYRAVETWTVNAGTTLYDLQKSIAASGGKGQTRLWLVNGLIPSSNESITNSVDVPQHAPDIHLKDGDVLTLALVCVPGYPNVSGIGYTNERADTWAKNIKLLRFVDADGSPISEIREVPAGEQFTAYGQWSLTHPAVYDGKYNAAGGFGVYISAVSDEPDSVGLATVNTGVTTATDGSFSVSFLEEGYYAVQLIHTASVNSEKPAQISASETMIVHVTAATNLSALKQGYQAELTAAYQAVSQHDFTEENWQKFEATYASGQTAIDAAETLSDANAAKVDAIAAMDAVERIDHDGILTAFRAKLAAVYDEADKLDKRDVDVVAAMAVAYNALSDYQKGLLTAAETAKVQNTLAVQSSLPEKEPDTYQVTLTVEGATPSIMIIQAFYYDENNKYQSRGQTATYATAVTKAAAEEAGYIGAASFLDMPDFSQTVTLRTDVQRGDCVTLSYYTGELTFDESYVTSGKAGFATLQRLELDDAWLQRVEGSPDISYGYSSDTSKMPNVCDAVPVERFSGLVLYVKGCDANIILRAGYPETDGLAEIRETAIAAINAEVAKLTRSEYTNEGWNKIIAAQNAGIAAVNAAESTETIEQAKEQAISNIQSLASEKTNLKDYEEGILGYVYVSVENNTFTTTTGGDTPAFTGYLVNNAPIGFTEDDTMMTLVLKALEESNFTWAGTGGKNGGERDYTITYLAEVAKGGKSLGEMDGANTSGWMGTLNDWFVNEGFQAFSVAKGNIEDGDIISVVFTLDGGKDVGSVWGDPDTSLTALTFSSGTLYPDFTPGETEYTLMLPGTSANLTITPTAKNKTYLVKAFLNEYNKDAYYYKRTEKMPVTVGNTIYIGVGDKSWPSMNNNTGYEIDYTGTKYTIHVTSTSSAEAVIALINKISTVNYSNYKAQDTLAKQARAAYNGLNAEAKSQVTNLSKLENAEAAVKKFTEIDQVKALLAAIPDVDKLTTSDKTKVQAARDAYDALSDEQRGYITVADVTKYNAAVEWLKKQGISTPESIIGSEKPPEEPAGEEIILAPEVKADKDGNAALSISSQDINDAIASAKEGGAASIVIAPQISGDASSLSVTLPKGSVGDILSDTNAGVAIRSELGQVELPQDALTAISDATNDASLTIHISIGESEDAASALEGQIGATENNLKDGTAVEVKLVSGNTEIRSFGGKNITLRLPVDKNIFEAGKSYMVYHISGSDIEKLDGKCVSINGNKFVEVTVSHLSIFVVLPAETMPFTDVASDAWYFEAVQYVYDNGLFNGTSTATFSPNTEMTRAMLATVLYRMAGEPSGVGENAPFTDVAMDSWYTDAVAWANENGIVSGYGNGLFGGNDSITREQLVVMLYRYAKFMKHDTAAAGDLSAFTDAGDASDWAVEALRWAYAEGLITGRTATTIVPQGTATRAEVATLLMRFGGDLAE